MMISTLLARALSPAETRARLSSNKGNEDVAHLHDLVPINSAKGCKIGEAALPVEGVIAHLRVSQLRHIELCDTGATSCPCATFSIRHFKAKPFWWEAHEPTALPEVPLPKDVPVAIVGGGYAGMNAALELSRNGIESIVLDAAEPGFGGSTRNGGLVSGGVNVGKRIINRALTPEEAKPFLNDAVDAFTNVENIITEQQHRLRLDQERLLPRGLVPVAL